MKKLIVITILLTSTIWYGCGGTRNTDIDKKQDIKIENNYSQGEKIILGNTFTYTPFNALKPMQIDNKTYNNVVISNDKSIIKTNWNTKYINTTITKYRTKKIEKTDYSFTYIGLFLVLIIGILLWFKLPSFKS